MSNSSIIGTRKGKPWVVVWTSQEDDWTQVPAPFERGTAGQSPFQAAIEIAQGWTASDRIVPVVLRPHRPWWIQPVGALPTENFAEQPFDRGSATGILLAVLRIFRREPYARIVLLRAADAVMNASDIELALDRAAGPNHALTGRDDVLVVSRGRSTELGTVVVTYRRGDGQWRVSYGLTEAPAPELTIGTAAALMQMFVDTQPELTHQIRTNLSGAALYDDQALDMLYPYLPETDFAAEVLARAPEADDRAVAAQGRSQMATSRMVSV